VLGCAISGAISVRQAVQNTSISLRAGLPTAAVVEMDGLALNEYVSLTGQWPEDVVGLSPQMLNKIGSLPQVKSYDYSVETILFSSELERHTPNDGIHEDLEIENMWDEFNLKGVRSTEFFEMEEGVIELTSGRMFSTEEVSNLSYVALISQNFAAANNLGIGSTLNMHNIIWDMRNTNSFDESFYARENIYSQRSYGFEVVGIFLPTVEFDTGDEWIDADFLNQLENQIYTPNTVSIAAVEYQLGQMAEMEPNEEHWKKDFWEVIWLQNIYVLHDPNDMDAFKQAVETITPEFYTVTYTSDAFANVASSVESLEDLSFAVLWATVFAAILILSLLIALFVRERKREIGTLLALGERRWRILFQIMLEVLVVAVPAIVLALFIGNLFSSGISESMLRNDLISGHISDQSMTFSTLDRMGLSNNVSAEEVLANYDTSLSAAAVFTFFTVSFATVMVAAIIPMLYILRLSPRKIMM